METARKSKLKTKDELRIEAIRNSKKLMYAEPTPDITFAVDQAKKRIRYRLKELRITNILRHRLYYSSTNDDKTFNFQKFLDIIVKPLFYSKVKMIDKLPLFIYNDLIGELRSAESRKRISTFQHHMKNVKRSRIQHLIDQQPNAVEAIRLKGLLKEDLHIARHLSMKFLNLVEHRRLEQLIAMNIESLTAKE